MKVLIAGFVQSKPEGRKTAIGEAQWPKGLYSVHCSALLLADRVSHCSVCAERGGLPPDRVEAHGSLFDIF